MVYSYKDRPLKICMLSYRIDPFCGGQGVYIKNLSKAIKNLGHHVEIISGPPQSFFRDVVIHRLKSLDLYNPDNLFRIPSLKELFIPVNLLEWLGVITMGFPEPFVFGVRAKNFLKNNPKQYDIIHDNQSLSYGIWSISKKIPTIATIHHPITKDREVAINYANSAWEKIKQYRWYSFVGMQKRVSRFLPKIITVSKSSKNDIIKDFKVSGSKIKVVHNGIDTNIFFPINHVKRCKGRIIVTTSSNNPMKGLKYLLKAVAYIRQTHDVKLVVVGNKKIGDDLLELIQQLDIVSLLIFTGRISNSNLAYEYNQANLAVVPSIYEGFSFPAVEAMACGIPVVGTTGGALPEVIGNAGILVPPRDYLSLSDAIIRVLNSPDLANNMIKLGILRVKNKFTWIRAAEETVKTYREAIFDYN